MHVLLFTVALQLLAAIVALSCARRPTLATALGASLGALGSLIGILPTLHVLGGAPATSLTIPWDTIHGSLALGLDPLSAFFLLPVLLLSALAAPYGASYLLADRHRKNLGAAWCFFNLFTAGMILVLLARNVLVFLMAWELMSLAAYCLVTYDYEKPDVQRAGWVYLVAAHIGVSFLMLAFLLLARHAGSPDFAAFHGHPLGAFSAAAILLPALVGFGTKAGLVPWHVWLPEAHPAAPSHVSALMSGIMIKIGFYGLLRVISFLGPPAAWWGIAIAALGLLTALTGIALALQQHDLKRALAYSSIENVGLIALAIGLGLWGQARQLPAVASLAFAAALLHIWNHALIKAGLFLTAGSVLHATGTRNMEKLGGLLHQMPWTAAAGIAGSLAIAALPPLNGFVGKWVLYHGLLEAAANPTAGLRSFAALATVAALAVVGALASLAFVRLIGIVFLGSPRSESAAHPHESSPAMLIPIYALIALSLVAALAPVHMAAMQQTVLTQILGPGLATAALPTAALRSLIHVNAALLVALGLGALALLAMQRRHRSTTQPTWGCGYLRPTPRMQYTAHAFSQMMAGRLLPRLLRFRPRLHAPLGLFPAPAHLAVDLRDPVSARAYEPLFQRAAQRCMQLRILQQGKLPIYLAYIVVMVVITLAWVSIRTKWVGP
jgi:formate hydrogenlyase subunit 3/multisubunit Na+/H+ antiporter MnhD subunit